MFVLPYTLLARSLCTYKEQEKKNPKLMIILEMKMRVSNKIGRVAPKKKVPY